MCVRIYVCLHVRMYAVCMNICMYAMYECMYVCTCIYCSKTKRAATKGDIDPDVYSLSAKCVYELNAGLTSCQRSRTDRPLINYEALLDSNHLTCEQ